MTRHFASRMRSRREFLAWTGRSIGAAALYAGFHPVSTQAAPPEASLDHKIGQMLMIGLHGPLVYADHPILQDIRERHLGGIILLEWAGNIQSSAQVAALVDGLQAAADVPLFISIDHEGGLINRLKQSYGFPPTVSHERLGEINDLSVTHTQASSMARTLARLHINLNLAPVVDVNVNPDNPIIARYQRSFSSDAAIVSSHAAAFVQAHHEQGILCTLKHFPGHGSSSDDSHVGLVDITATWSANELQPFTTLIQDGQADAVMTAHVFNGRLDLGYPATLSQRIITGLLRENIGYDGVVISDDMLMGAISNYYGFGAAIHRAIEAGVDILLFAGIDPALTARAHATIKQLVQEGSISEARIDDSYRRILRLKQRLFPELAAPPASPAPPPPAPDERDEQFFAETGQTVRGPFLAFWQQHGGLEQFGYPLTGEFAEDGYTVQYFERARLEQHPQQSDPPDQIVLGPLGRIITAHRQHELPFQRAIPGQNPGPYIAETGHHLDLKFLGFWEQHGGLPLFGYPISEPFPETNPADGLTYLVQYFERARFEYHPEQPESQVMLGMLGMEVLQARGQRP